MNDPRALGTPLAGFVDLTSDTLWDDAGGPMPIVCLSHLRWSFVWQRPQHLLTRITRERPVYFVEEPLRAEDEGASCLRETVNHGVTVLTPVLSADEFHTWGFNADNNEAIRVLLADWFEATLSRPEVIAWYYTPMAMGALPSSLEPVATIFDAMDELSNFRGAPAELRLQEQRLLHEADLVFAGGPSLYEARRVRRPDAHCFPSGVDAAHFGADGLKVPDDIAHLTGPIIGFYGVIDERIDLDLIAGIADLRPDWTILMIGPLAKIEESDLPRRANIHYPGMRTYDQLPAYLSAFDAAILPFAMNEATRFISPTKTLEYLSGGKPVVSTAIKDVIDLYGDVVEIADGPEEFVQAIEFLWGESDQFKRARARKVEEVLHQHDWDVIAASMTHLLEGVLGECCMPPVPVNGISGRRTLHRVPAMAMRAEMAD